MRLGPPMYRPPYKAPVFNHELSYWYRAYGVKLADVRAAKIVISGIRESGMSGYSPCCAMPWD